MRDRFVPFVFLILVSLLLSRVVFAQTAQQSGAANAEPAAAVPKRDLSGVWTNGRPPQLQGGKLMYGTLDQVESPGGEIPPMTPWAKAKFDLEKPGYGPRAAPGGNDPILVCDPMGFPRILWSPAYPISEFMTGPDRVVQFFNWQHVYRYIWTDGRELPKDVDPTWYGNSIGKWVDDYTFVVETNGVDDRTWLGSTGYPHSDSMQVEERYHRVDCDTIDLTITMTDPVAYTKPWVAAPMLLKLDTKNPIRESLCVWSEENSFSTRIRALAAEHKKK